MNEIKNTPMDEYRKLPGLSNHALQIFKKSPGLYIWNKTAPSDPNKANDSDIGTALHALLLEPDTFDDLVGVANVKGRTTQAFQKQQLENPDKIILTEIEYEQVRLMGLSAESHPLFNELLKANGQCEHSIFVDCPDTGLRLKIRPDKICRIDGMLPIYSDVKTTASLDDFYSEQTWKNPLFSMGYGFTAAYYMHVGSIFEQVELTEYTFLVVQKTANLGRYPVDVITIYKDDLIELGFWDEMLNTLNQFKICKESNAFKQSSLFPRFEFLRKEEFIDEVEVTFEGGNNE